MTKYYDSTPWCYWVAGDPANLTNPAADRTIGCQFYLVDTGEFKGVRFYTAHASTFRCSIWAPDGGSSPVVTVDKVVNPGEENDYIDAEFATPYVVTDAYLAMQARTSPLTCWFATVYDLGGTPKINRFLMAGHYPYLTEYNNVMRAGLGVHYQNDNGASPSWHAGGPGESRPTTVTNNAYPVDPLFVPDSEAYEPTPFSRVYGSNRSGNTLVSTPGQDYSVGVMVTPFDNCVMRGVRFHTKQTGLHKVSLWNTAGVRLAEGTLNVTAPGTYEVPFSSPYTFTDTDISIQRSYWQVYFVASVYVAGANQYTGAPDTPFLDPGGGACGAGRSLHNGYHPYFYSVGDAKPTTWGLPGGYYVPVDPLIDLVDQTKDSYRQSCIYNGPTAPGYAWRDAQGPNCTAYGGRVTICTPGQILGIRTVIDHPIGTTRTYRAKLWLYDEDIYPSPFYAEITSKSQAILSTGTPTEHEFLFDTPVDVTPRDIARMWIGGSYYGMWMFTIYDVTGESVVQTSLNGTQPWQAFRDHQAVLGRGLHTWESGSYACSLTDDSVGPIYTGYFAGPGGQFPVDLIFEPTLTPFVDPSPPVINPYSPLDGDTEVDKAAPIIWTAVDPDDDIVLTLCRAWVKGDLVFTGSGFSTGWKSSYYERITNGYRFTLIPDRTHYYRDGEDVTVRAYAEDSGGLSDDENWTFTPERFALRIYRYLQGSVRELDEE